MIYKEPHIVAEICCNHQGDIKIAKKMIETAANGKATVAKFQKRNNKEFLTNKQYNSPHPNKKCYCQDRRRSLQMPTINFGGSVMYDKPIPNLLVMTHLATGYTESVKLSQAEMTLAKDKNPETINASWDILCGSVKQRTGIEIEGNFELETLGGRPIH